MKSIKHILLVALVMAITMNAYGQAPQLINYQAVARDASGSILALTTVGVRFTIHDGSATGAAQYQETQAVITNVYGLFTLQVGGGTVATGSMSGIVWGTNPKFLQVEVDPTGGSSYVDMGTQQLVSVPYSLHAGTSDAATTLTGTVTMGGDVSGTNSAATVTKLQGNDVSATAPAIHQVLKWSGTAWTPANDSTTSYSAGAGLSLTGTTFSMPNVGTAGIYGSATQVPVLTTDAQGRVTGVTNTPITLTSGTVTSIATTAPLTGGPITSTGTIGMATSGVTAGPYGSATQIPSISVDVYGRVTAASSNTIVTVPAGTSTGDMLYWNGSAWVRVPVGTSGQTLVLNGSTPIWTTTVPLFIGEIYGGGIIAYILQPGDPGFSATTPHGIIAAPTDQSTGIEWSLSVPTYTFASATAIGTGQLNTTTIITIQGAGSYAATLCDSLVLNGYSDWYLPSKDELNKLYINRAAIGGFDGTSYWSSSEADNYDAWYQNFPSGLQGNLYKTTDYYVRAVRSF